MKWWHVATFKLWNLLSWVDCTTEFFCSLCWNPEVPTPLISVKALSRWLLPFIKKSKQHFFWVRQKCQWSVRSTRNGLQRKFHANHFFYNSKLWLFVAVSTNLYLYSWQVCLLLAVLVIVQFSQSAEANFHKGVRPLPAVHSISLDSCILLLEFFFQKPAFPHNFSRFPQNPQRNWAHSGACPKFKCGI
jgi:hypothetical protein